MSKQKRSNKSCIENRRVRHNYFVEDTLECGIVLKGNEIKSIRYGMANLNDAYVDGQNGQLYLLNCYVTKWETANNFDVSERRSRVLLAHKREINNLLQKKQEKGYTLMPLKLYINGDNRCKVEIGLCKGKHLYDKREAEKIKTIKREMERDYKV